MMGPFTQPSTDGSANDNLVMMGADAGVEMTTTVIAPARDRAKVPEEAREECAKSARRVREEAREESRHVLTTTNAPSSPATPPRSGVGRAIFLAAAVIGVIGVTSLMLSDGRPKLWGVPLVLVVGAVCVLVNWIAFVPAFRMRDERFYDLTGSVTALLVVTTVTTGLVMDDTLTVARGIVLFLVVVWTVRLGLFLSRRVHRAGKDGRFDEIKQSAPRFFVAWTLQALWIFLNVLATIIVVTALAPLEISSPFFVGGVAMWILGFGIEVVADEQKRVFAGDEKNRGRFINVGLWAWARHPNYFGEIMLWAGLFVVGLDVYRGFEWIAVLSPLFVYILLAKGSGVPLLEARADDKWGHDAEYQAYKATTPVLVPRPPR